MHNLIGRSLLHNRINHRREDTLEKTMNVSLHPAQPSVRVAETPSSALLQDARLAKLGLQDAVVLSKTPASGIQNQDVYRSVLVGAGIGGVSGAISGLFNPKASVQTSSIVGATAGAISGAVVGVITKNSASQVDAVLHSALASAGIGVLQTAAVGKHSFKDMASGILSGAFRGAVVSYQLYERGMQRATPEGQAL